MNEADLHNWATWLESVRAGATCITLIFVTAPYGRHARPGWGPTAPNLVGWVIMELPAVALFLWIYCKGQDRLEVVPLTFLAMWQFHYLHRTFIFPFLLRTKGKRIALSIVAMGVIFNSLNAYLNARWLSHLGQYDMAWLYDPRFIIGAFVFAIGFWVNFKADRMLIRLRKPGETDYKIPRGWLYERITCPNYFGEILEWTGFAIATWSVPGLAFALYTAANVGPRAFANRRWYRARFPDYPADRKAIIPFVL